MFGTIAQEFHKWPSENNDAWAFGSRSYVPEKFRDDLEIKAAYERSRSLFLEDQDDFGFIGDYDGMEFDDLDDEEKDAMCENDWL